MKEKIVLISAIVAGLLAALLTRAYLAAKESELENLKAQFVRTHGVMEVLCYRTDVPGGTVLAKEHLGKASVPAAGLRGHALTSENLRDVLGRKIVFGHRRKEVLFWEDVEGGNPADHGLSAAVKKQMRAVSIAVSGSAAVSGMVKPNDHVDVIGTFTFPDAAGRISKNDAVTCTILQNVLVLAAGRETASSASAMRLGATGQRGYATVTLEVTPREAEMLAFAEQVKGRLSLTLRNRNDVHFEKELPMVDFKMIQGEIGELNARRQARTTR